MSSAQEKWDGMQKPEREDLLKKGDPFTWGATPYEWCDLYGDERLEIALLLSQPSTPDDAAGKK